MTSAMAESSSLFHAGSISIAIASESFAEVTGAALAFGFTRDPFDRLIAGHAQLNRATLLTFDTQLHRHYADALA